MPHSSKNAFRKALELLGQGRNRPAIEAFRQAMSLDPGAADGWYNLGWLLKAEGLYEDALEAYGRALSAGVSSAEEVHLNRATIYSDHLRRDEDAHRELVAALRIAPDYLPALLNLGNLAEERGRRDDAIAHYDAIVARASRGGRIEQQDAAHYCDAVARLAHLRPPDGIEDPSLLRLKQLAASTLPIDPGIRANLLFSLGRALDLLGAHDEAMQAFNAANAHSRPRAKRHDRRQVEALADALIAAFPRAARIEPGTAAPGQPEPLFICGMFRSGSTLVEQVVASHPQGRAGGELDILRRMVMRELAPFPASMQAPDPSRDRALAMEYRTQLAKQFPDAGDARYVTDKRPDNFQLIGLIKQLFPSAKIIHTVRHPADTALSIYMQHLNTDAFSYSTRLDDIGHYYAHYRRLMAHWKRLYPDSIHDFDYDAFVARPEQTVRPLLGFLGLAWHPDCLQFHRLHNTVKTASYWQVRRPLYGEASGRWRRYRSHLDPLFETLASQGVPASAD